MLYLERFGTQVTEAVSRFENGLPPPGVMVHLDRGSAFVDGAPHAKPLMSSGTEC